MNEKRPSAVTQDGFTKWEKPQWQIDYETYLRRVPTQTKILFLIVMVTFGGFLAMLALHFGIIVL